MRLQHNTFVTADTGSTVDGLDPDLFEVGKIAIDAGTTPRYQEG